MHKSHEPLIAFICLYSKFTIYYNLFFPCKLSQLHVHTWSFSADVLIEQDVVMQRLALESDDDKEQHFLDYEVRSLKPRECRFLSFGLFDIWCSCQDDKPFSIGETWEQIVRATQKARSLCCAWCGRTDQTFWYYNGAFWCIFKYLSVIGVGFNSFLLLALFCPDPPITGLRGRRPCRLRKRWTWDAWYSNLESEASWKKTHAHTPMLKAL